MKAGPHAAVLVAGLGAAQLVAWGTLYYAVAVMGEPMRAELGLSSGHVFGAFAWGMVVSGVLAPWAGRTLDRYGGRAVLASSSLVGALGFVVLGHAHSFGGLLIGWSIQGLAMALGLYDTCFAAIGHVAPGNYRRTVTGVTLVAGFASTIAWPATHYLLQSVGWRAGCEVYALAMFLCAPIYVVVLPALGATHRAGQATCLGVAPQVSKASRRRARLLAFAFAGTAVVGASMSAHVVGMLQALQLPRADAVWIAASIGVMQVVGRLLELALGSRHNPTQLGLVTFSGLCVAMVLLLLVPAFPSAVYLFALTYGIANGLLTIAKATVPVEMFGLANAGAVLGNFSAPSVVTRALSPFAFAVATDAVGTQASLLGLTAAGVASLVAYFAAIGEQANPRHTAVRAQHSPDHRP